MSLYKKSCYLLSYKRMQPDVKHVFMGFMLLKAMAVPGQEFTPSLLLSLPWIL